jgi:hypothetical protein
MKRRDAAVNVAVLVAGGFAAAHGGKLYGWAPRCEPAEMHTPDRACVSAVASHGGKLWIATEAPSVWTWDGKVFERQECCAEPIIRLVAYGDELHGFTESSWYAFKDRA